METLVSANSLSDRRSSVACQQKRFADLISQLESALQTILGTDLRPSSPISLAKFAQLPAEIQNGITDALETHLSFAHAAIRSRVVVEDEKVLLRMAMNKLGLVADDDAIEKVESTDIVEIFDPNHIQVYRSFSCFRLCNYSIAELVTYPWYELYERPSWVTGRIMELAGTVYSGQNRLLELEPLMATYSLKETLTTERAVFQVQERFYARLLSKTNEPYVLSVKRIIPVKKSESAELAFL